MTFIFLGHDSPAGEYPAPVVPVGEHKGALCVSYRTEHGAEFEKVQRSAKFVRHRLEDFDVERHALFAFAPDDVVFYPIEDEVLFFDAVLQDPRMTEACPFFRLSLASETGHEDLIASELARARARMDLNAPHYAETWYESKVAQLGDLWKGQPSALIRNNSSQSPSSARAVLAPVTFAARTFDRELSHLQDLIARLSDHGNAAARLEEVRRATVRQVSVALADPATATLMDHLKVPGVVFEAPPEAAGVDLWVQESNARLHWPRERCVFASAVPFPILPNDRSWIGRVESGVARLEETIALAVRDRIRVPMLRAAIDEAIDVGHEHVTELNRRRAHFEEESERIVDAVDRLSEAWNKDTLLMGNRCKAMVSNEVKNWDVPVFFSSRTSDEIRRLDHRCQARIQEIVGDYVRMPWEAAKPHPHIAPLIKQLPPWPAREVLRPPETSWITLEHITSLLTSGIAGAVLAVFDTIQARPHKIKEQLIRTYSRVIDDWVASASSFPIVDVTAYKSLMHARFEHANKIRHLIIETSRSVKRLRKLRASLP